MFFRWGMIVRGMILFYYTCEMVNLCYIRKFHLIIHGYLVGNLFVKATNINYIHFKLIEKIYNNEFYISKSEIKELFSHTEPGTTPSPQRHRKAELGFAVEKLRSQDDCEPVSTYPGLER